MRLTRSSKTMRKIWRPLAYASIALLTAASTQAQIRTGGKGGGIPGGDPGTSTGDPTRTTGGQTQPDLMSLYHVLDRVTYGADSEMLEQVRQLGIENFIRLQLSPELIPENPELLDIQATLPPMFSPLNDPLWVWDQLYQDYTWRARYSSRQLNEIMTEFWEEHFDTGLDTGNGGFTGYDSSLVFHPVNNQPWLVYWDRSRQRARFAYRDGANVWQIGDIDGRYRAGEFPDLAFDPLDQPVVSYYNGRDRQLRVAWADGVRFNVTTVDDQTTDVMGWTSIAVDSAGDAWVSYAAYDFGMELQAVLKVARYDSALGTWDPPVTVDASPGVGFFSSLALDASEQPAVAYFDYGTQNLKYASFDGAVWTTETVDATAGTGWYASLAFNPSNDRPGIAYHDAIQTAAKFVEHDGGGWPAPSVVDDTGETGQYTTLAYSAAGQPSVGYHETDNYQLVVSTWDGAAWVPDLPVTTVPPQIRGAYGSIAFNPVTGEPAVAYQNGSRFSLRFVESVAGTWVDDSVEDYGTSRFLYVKWERDEGDGFRANALGKFRDLLSVSAESAAMMLFLNNNENVAGRGNENYARELLELHTVGVDGGYSQLDVETAARAFTGWGLALTSARCDVSNGDFCYNHLAHDGTEKTILGQTFAQDTLPNDASSWQKQGNEILDFLAVHPETAKFVCGKLLQKFIDDHPPQRLWNECKSTFLESDGDIKRVMETILFSKEFLGTDYHYSKVRTPLEYVMAGARNLESESPNADFYSFWFYTANLGMELFRNTVPTGYSELGVDWVSSNSLLKRWQYADALTHYRAYDIVVSPLNLVLSEAPGVSTADGVVKFFGDRLLRGNVGAIERALMVDCLDGGNPGSWDISSGQADGRVRDMVGIMMGFPLYEKQ